MKSITLLLVVGIFAFASCQSKTTESVTKVVDPIEKAVAEIALQEEKAKQEEMSKDPMRDDKIVRTDAEWEEELNALEFRVLRKEGTERAFTGDLWDHKGDGVYTCRGCALPLFDSDTKFKSGTGWPSFYQPIGEDAIGEDTDYKIGYARTEVHCARCDGHLSLIHI